MIAEDLVAREPWEAAHIERFRRALVMLRVPEPDSVIAERLSGQTPFIATDHFSDPAPAASVSAPPLPEAAGPPVNAGPPVPRRAGRVLAPDGAQVGRNRSDRFSRRSAGRPGALRPAPAVHESLDEVFKDFRNDAGRKGAATSRRST